MTESDI